MAWTAELIKKEKEATHLDLVVRFSDGTTVIEERYRITRTLTVASFKALVRRKIVDLESLPQSDTNLSLGVVDLVPPVVVPPTPAEIAEQRWRQKFDRLQVAQMLVDHGVISNILPAYVNLRNEVQADFLPAYFANL